MAKSNKKKAVSKKSKAPAKKAVKKTVNKVGGKKSAAKKTTEKKAELMDHVITQWDLDNKPEFVAKGLKLGDVIQVPKTGAFHLTVLMNDETFEVDTDDVKESILALKPTIFKTKVVIKASYLGGKPAEYVLFNARAKRLFSNPLTAEFFAKNLKLALNATQHTS